MIRVSFLLTDIYLFINIYLINKRMLQILQRYHVGSRVDGPPQVTLEVNNVRMFDVYLICLHCSEGQVQVRTNQGLCVHQNDLLLCHSYLSCIVSAI